MGTTADKLLAVKNSKLAIKQALIAKGSDITDLTTFAQYSTKITLLTVGGLCDTTQFLSDMMAIIGVDAEIPEVSTTEE